LHRLLTARAAVARLDEGRVAFQRLRFSTVRQVVPPDVPYFVEFVVNDGEQPAGN